MTHGSLFSGIGGFDLAAEWMGWENLFHCEIDPFCQKILKYHFPNAVLYEDIHAVDFTIWRGRIDILTGGFPCQPFSLAGKRRGTDDDRHLWPEMLRAVREIKPRWIVGENVFGIVSWDGGVVFEQVCLDLEAEGYSVQPYVLPAAAVNAPHRRDRVWFVAHRNPTGFEDRDEQCGGQQASCGEGERGSCGCGVGSSPDTEGKRHKSSTDGRESVETQEEAVLHGRKRDARTCSWQDFPTQPPICGGDDGIPRGLDGITFSRWRIESIKAYGNAVVPPLIYHIFKAIELYEREKINSSPSVHD